MGKCFSCLESPMAKIGPKIIRHSSFKKVKTYYDALREAGYLVPEHIRGGAWSKKVDARETCEVFIDAMAHCFVNGFLTNYKEAIVGVSVSPKGQFHIIKVWNTTTNITDRKLFAPSMKMKATDDIVYKAHNTRPK